MCQGADSREGCRGGLSEKRPGATTFQTQPILDSSGWLHNSHCRTKAINLPVWKHVLKSSETPVRERNLGTKRVRNSRQNTKVRGEGGAWHRSRYPHCSLWRTPQWSRWVLAKELQPMENLHLSRANVWGRRSGNWNWCMLTKTLPILHTLHCLWLGVRSQEWSWAWEGGKNALFWCLPLCFPLLDSVIKYIF